MRGWFFGVWLMCVGGATQATVLRVGVGESPPISFMEQDTPAGIEVELMAELHRIDPSLEFSGLDKPLPIARVIEEERLGHIDLSVSVKSPERAWRYHFLEPAILTTRVRLLGQQAEPLRITSLDDIVALRDNGTLLAQPGSTPYNMIAHYPGLPLDAAPVNVEQMLKKLVLNRGRFAIGLESSMQYTVNRLGLSSQVRWQPLNFGSVSLHLIASRHLPDAMLVRLDSAWKKLAMSPKLKEIVNRYAGEPLAETP